MLTSLAAPHSLPPPLEDPHLRSRLLTFSIICRSSTVSSSLPCALRSESDATFQFGKHLSTVRALTTCVQISSGTTTSAPPRRHLSAIHSSSLDATVMRQLFLIANSNLYAELLIFTLLQFHNCRIKEFCAGKPLNLLLPVD